MKKNLLKTFTAIGFAAILAIIPAMTAFASTTADVDGVEYVYEPGHVKAYAYCKEESPESVEIPKSVEIDGETHTVYLANGFMKGSYVDSITYSGESEVQNGSEHGVAIAFMGSNASYFATTDENTVSMANGGMVFSPDGSKIYHVGKYVDFDAECASASQIDRFAFSSAYEFMNAYNSSGMLASLTADKVMAFSYGSGKGSGHSEREYSGFVLNGQNVFCLDASKDAPEYAPDESNYEDGEKAEKLNALFAVSMPNDACGIFEMIAEEQGEDYGQMYDAALSVTGNMVWKITNGRSFDVDDCKNVEETGLFVDTYKTALENAVEAITHISLPETIRFSADENGFKSETIRINSGRLIGFDPYSCGCEIEDYNEDLDDITFRIRTGSNPEGQSFIFTHAYGCFDVYGQNGTDTQKLAAPGTDTREVCTVGTLTDVPVEEEPVIENDVTPEPEPAPALEPEHHSSSSGSSSGPSSYSVEITPSSSLRFAKKAMDSKAYLAGADITVTRAEDGAVILQFTTAAEDYFMSLPDGNYIFTETKAPDGYEIADPIAVTIIGGIAQDKENNCVVMYDMPIVATATPKTGDTSNTLIILGLVLAGITAAYVLIIKKRTTSYYEN